MMDVVADIRSRAGFLLLAKLHLRTILGRPEMDILSVVLLAVVGSLAGLGLMLNQAIADIFERSGESDTVLIIAEGASGESESFIDATSAFGLRSMLSGRGESDLDYDPQMAISAAFDQGGTRKSLVIRGLSGESSRAMKRIRIVEGKMFDPEFNQLIVGKSALRSFPSFGVGKKIEIANQTWVVSGVFDMGGDVRENEVIGDIGRVQFAHRTGSSVNSIRIVAADPASAVGIVNAVDKDDALGLTARIEKDYFLKRAEPIVEAVRRLQILIMGLMIPTCLLGLLSIQKIQHANILSELKMLNFIGFQADSIRLSLLARAIALGCIAASLAASALHFGIAGRSTEVGLGLQILDVRFVPNLTAYSVILFGTCALSAAVGWLSKINKELYQ